MKKVILTGIIAAGTIGSGFAQSTSKAANASGVIISGGLNASNITKNDNGDINDNNTKLGWRAGLALDMPIAGNILYFQPGVYATTKGAKYVIGDENSSNFARATLNPLYVEVPVNFVLKFPILPSLKVFAGAGPYIAAGVAGKNKFDGKVLGVSFSQSANIKYSNDNPTSGSDAEAQAANLGTIRRWDYGANILAGVEISRFLVSLNYGIGLAKLSPGTDSQDGQQGKNRVFSASVGIKF